MTREPSPSPIRPFPMTVRTALVLATVAIIGGTGTLAAAAAVPQLSWPSERPPRPLAAHDVKFPPYEIQTLPNGLQVVAVLHHEQPAVSMRLLVRAGSSFDRPDKLGAANLAATLLNQGTTSRSAEELADAVDFIGGAMGTGAGTDLSFLQMIVMKDSFGTGLRMLSDMARHPAFAPAEIDRQRQQILSGLRVSFEDPSYVANAVFDRLVYGFHPYGMPQTGTPDTIGDLTRDNLMAFHRKYFAPNNAILAIVGDVTSEQAFAEARAVFGDWERRDVPTEKFVEPPDPTRRVVVVNKPDAVQTEVRVGHVGIRRNHPDYMALNLAIRILGGEGSNRLHQVLRTERGLTYGAQANMDALKRSGDFEAETNTRSAATSEVLRLIVDEFWRLQRERVSERELDDAKAYLAGSFPLTIETPDQIALQVLNALFYDLPLRELQSFRERVNAVTVDDIQRVARAYLKPDRLSVVLVGNAAAFESQLNGAGFDKFERIELGSLDLTAADLKRPKAAAGGAVRRRDRGPGSFILRPSSFPRPLLSFLPSPSSFLLSHSSQPPLSSSPIVPEEGARARALLDRVVAAKGGLERLRGIRTIVASTSSTAETDRGRVEVQSTTRLEYPNRVRIETRLPAGLQIQVYDGHQAWVRNGFGVREVPDRVVTPQGVMSPLRDLDAEFRRDTIALLVAAENGAVRARALPDVKTDAKTEGQQAAWKRYHALELSGKGVEPVVLYIDPDTDLIARQAYVASGPEQPLIDERFGDYRTVDGVQVAFTAAVFREGKPILERRVLEIAFNTPLDPSLFKKPSP